MRLRRTRLALAILIATGLAHAQSSDLDKAQAHFAAGRKLRAEGLTCLGLWDQELLGSCLSHKAFVKVDEKGTEAAAATAVVMAVRGGAPPKGVSETLCNLLFSGTSKSRSVTDEFARPKNQA